LTRQFSTAAAFEELDETLQTGDTGKRTELLRRITDLFFQNNDRLSDEQNDVFDRTLLLLIAHVEKRVLAELSRRLAGVRNAPTNVVRALACDPEISVAEPVLESSLRLTSDDLVQIARIGTQAHLLAISRRKDLNEKVSDVLIAKGNREVRRQVAANSDCHLSYRGFETLVRAAEADDTLAEITGGRHDLPKVLWRQLVEHASDAVRQKLVARLGDNLQGEVTQALTDIAAAIDREVAQPLNFAAALQFVTLLNDNGELDEAALVAFAKTGRYEETVAALAVLSSSSIEIIRPLMQRHRRLGLLVPCRSAQLSWNTASLLLRGGLSLSTASVDDLKTAQSDFAKLSVAGARRLLRFWQARKAALAPQQPIAPREADKPNGTAPRKLLQPSGPAPAADRILARGPQMTGKDRIVIEAYDLAREVAPDGTNADSLLAAIENAAQQGERDPIKLCDVAVRACRGLPQQA
jgi:uncharacterized protein (DUF2336 family)